MNKDSKISNQIDALEKVILELSASFKALDANQSLNLQKHIEASSATVVTETRKDINRILIEFQEIKNLIKGCPCNKEILKAISNQIGGIPSAIPSTKIPQTSLPEENKEVKTPEKNVLPIQGMARDDKSPSGKSPATISSWTYNPRP